MLYFLYYTIHVPVIAKIVSFIMGIVFGFLAHKFSRHAIANFFGIYYGGFAGAIIGCIISERLRYIGNCETRNARSAILNQSKEEFVQSTNSKVKRGELTVLGALK